MKSTDTLDMQGYLTIHIFNPIGQLIQTTQKHNSIVYSGRDLVARLFANQQISPVRYIAVGTGAKSVDPLDTALQKEVFRKELKTFVPSKDLTDFLQDGEPISQMRRRIMLSADLGFIEPPLEENNDEAYELREAGLFNSAEPGTGVMYNRVVFPSIRKNLDFKLTLVWEIIF